MMDLGEGLILAIVERVLTDRQEELKTLERDIPKLEAIASPFPRLHYDECVKMLQEGNAKGELENNFEWGGDFGAPDETYLSNQFGKPIWVHHFPAAIKGFYFEVDKDRPETALGIDLLAPEGYGEIIGGGERAASLRRPSNGTSTFAGTAAFPTPDSAWVLNAPLPGCPASSTCVRRSLFRECCIG
jgi:asparaginyl-tRNA synthetase